MSRDYLRPKPEGGGRTIPATWYQSRTSPGHPSPGLHREACQFKRCRFPANREEFKVRFVMGVLIKGGYNPNELRVKVEV